MNQSQAEPEKPESTGKQQTACHVAIIIFYGLPWLISFCFLAFCLYYLYENDLGDMALFFAFPFCMFAAFFTPISSGGRSIMFFVYLLTAFFLSEMFHDRISFEEIIEDIECDNITEIRYKESSVVDTGDAPLGRSG